MKLLTATVLLLSPLASSSPCLSQVAASAQNSQTISIARSGSQPSQKGAAERFTGSVRIDPLFGAKDPSRMSGAYVTFEPGARTAWHTHPFGQMLIVTAGAGRGKRWGGPIEGVREGKGGGGSPRGEERDGGPPKNTPAPHARQKRDPRAQDDW